MNELFRLWLTTGFTVFCNGLMDGFSSGLVVGGGNGVRSGAQGATDTQSLSLAVAEGFALGLLGHGLQEFTLWRRANPMPNPFLTTKRMAAVQTNPPFVAPAPAAIVPESSRTI